MPAETDGQGASFPAHNPSPQDHFPTRHTTSGGTLIPDDWDDEFSAAPAPDAANPFVNPDRNAPTPSAGVPVFIPDSDPAEPSSVESTPPPVETRPIVEPKTVPVPSNQVEPDKASRAFLEALGLDGLKIEDAELEPTMARMGNVLRTMIGGLREILMTRTSIKSEFRIEQTQISAGGNNPLKFSISPEQAVQNLVYPTTKGYLDATEATEEALSDLKAHEIAVITGMESALKGLLRKLDPVELEKQISTKGGLGNVLKSKKSKYWEIYQEMYAEISDEAEDDFHQLFSREFARAYKEQLDKLK